MLFASSISLWLTACSGSGGSAPSVPQSAPASTATTDRGAEIVAEYLKRDSAPYRHDKVRFTVREDDGKTSVTEVEVWRKQADGTTTTTSTITKPAEDAGTGSLTVEEKDKSAVQTTYSKSRDEFRDTDTGKMFFGGLTAQELLGEWGKYDFKFIAERDLGGKKAFDIEGKLRSGQRSPIASMKITFDAETYLPVEMHLIDATGKEMRTYSKAEVRNVGGRTFTGKIEVDNLVYGSHTTIEVLARDYPDRLDDAIFSKERLRASAK